VYKEHQGFLELKALKELKGHRVLKALKDFKDL
jgi:hypothetical protein